MGSTQKTNIGKPPRDPNDPNGEWVQDPDVIDPGEVDFDEDALADLGLQREEPHVADPAGFNPDRAPEDVAGRRMIRLSGKDLANLHEAHAPGQSMVPDPYEDESDRALPDPEKMREKEIDPEVEDRKKKQEAADLMSGFSTNPQEQTQQPNSPQQQQPQTSKPSSDDFDEPNIDIQPGQVGEAVQVLEVIMQQVAKHKAQGDLRTANELSTIARGIIDAGKVKRTQEEKERHPVLQSLLSNLGLEKIKPVELSWMGQIWVFAPRPQPLDFWIAESVRDNAIDLNLLLAAATCVGMGVDKEGAPPPAPLWEVFNIGLTADYEMVADTPEGIPDDKQVYKVQVYTKTCESCANEVPIQNEKCELCGSIQDKFDVPVQLRLRYANLMQNLLEEKLGLNAGHYADLVDQMRKVMKDRRLDKEELYPLALPLFKAEKTHG